MLHRIQDFLDEARIYLWKGLPQYKKEQYQPQELKLNGALQYRLCDAFDRLIGNFGEFTKKDIAMMIEAWIMAQGTLRPTPPIDNEFKQ